MDFSATYKVLVLGDSNVGKTCIVHRYCDERYYDTYISTIGEDLIYMNEFFMKSKATAKIEDDLSVSRGNNYKRNANISSCSCIELCNFSSGIMLSNMFICDIK